MNDIKVRDTGITKVTVGLSKRGQKWIWKDRSSHNNSEGALRDHNYAYITWDEDGNKWILKDIDVTARLHLCERRGGKTLVTLAG